MREKLNSNPIAQVAVIAVLVAAAAYMLLGGGGEESEGSTAATSTTTAATSSSATPASGETSTAGATTATTGSEAGGTEAGVATEAPAALPASVPTPPPPAQVTAAYKANKAVVLLVVRDGGIDDRLARSSASRLSSDPRVALFVVRARRISRYAAITFGVDVQNVPALVVVSPRHLSGHAPQASVSYGFQTPGSVVQAVHDALYKGPETTYHPN